MAVTYGFYNSLNKDRMYNAEQMSSIFNGIITDGVFSTVGDALMTVAGTGMQVIVKPGRAWFNSTWTLNDALLPLDIPTADVSLTRIDAVILEVNSAIATRANSIKVLKGTASANPAKPTLSSTETLHQYALAYVTVAAGATSITAANIEVNVGKTGCPFITSVLQQTDITDLFNQWEAEFDTWFANLQSQLSGNVAANLQRQIDELKVATGSTITKNTAIAANLEEGSTVDDAIRIIGSSVYLSKIQKAQCIVTVKYASGNPVSEILIDGLTDINGDALYTDSNGIAVGYCSAGSFTVGVKDYADLTDATETITAVIGNSYSVDLTVSIRNFLALMSSKSVRFSKNVSKLNYSIIGGGGGGGSGSQNGVGASQSWGIVYGGGGGGAGYAKTIQDATFSINQLYAAVVGAGGTGGVPTGSNAHNKVGKAGSNGGKSSFMGNTVNGGNGGAIQSGDTTIGGTGGTGLASGGYGAYSKSSSYNGSNYNGGRKGSGGGNSTVNIYTSHDALSLSGGGGGGGYARSSFYNGESYDGGSNGLASNTYGSGGSGGGAYEYLEEKEDDNYNRYTLYSGGNGKTGAVLLSMDLLVVS